MRRAKTRTRPLDIYKRMPILRKQDELPIDAETVDSAVVVSRGERPRTPNGLPARQGRARAQCHPARCFVCARWHELQRIGIVDLPVPEVSAVDTYEEETKGGFKPPRPYIRHKPGTQIRSLTCEYEADHDELPGAAEAGGENAARSSGLQR